jgi:sulfatase maturation enzyme AslB (radical SAM superfamily)
VIDGASSTCDIGQVDGPLFINQQRRQTMEGSKTYMVTIHGVGNITDEARNIQTILTSKDNIQPRERVEVVDVTEQMTEQFWMRVAAHLEPEITQYRAMQNNAFKAGDAALHIALIDCYDKYADQSMEIAAAERWLRLVRGENPDRGGVSHGYMGGLD